MHLSKLQEEWQAIHQWVSIKLCPSICFLSRHIRTIRPFIFCLFVSVLALIHLVYMRSEAIETILFMFGMCLGITLVECGGSTNHGWHTVDSSLCSGGQCQWIYCRYWIYMMCACAYCEYCEYTKMASHLAISTSHSRTQTEHDHPHSLCSIFCSFHVLFHTHSALFKIHFRHTHSYITYYCIPYTNDRITPLNI